MTEQNCIYSKQQTLAQCNIVDNTGVTHDYNCYSSRGVGWGGGVGGRNF